MANGWLHRLHRGVYSVGHTRLSVKGRWTAAVLACGPDAVLSHRSAAALHDIQRIPGGRIDVTAPSGRVIRGVRCHTSRSLADQDRTIIDGIPVSSIERTLLDLAAIYSRQRLRSTIEAAQRRDLLDRDRFDSLLARSVGHRGAMPLKRGLAQLHDAAPWTQSSLEQRFLELIRDAGLPEPRTNVLVDGELVDCLLARAQPCRRARQLRLSPWQAASSNEDRRQGHRAHARRPAKRSARHRRPRRSTSGAALIDDVSALLG